MNTKTPNIIIIVTDQQHFNTISALGNGDVSTAAMDKLVHGGTTFLNSYCANPICGPSRSSFLTGRMPSETGAHSNGFNIRSSIPNIGQWIRQHTNYDVIYSGIWHCRMPHTSLIPGFDVIASGINCHGQLSDTSVTQSCEAYIHNRKKDKPFFMAVMYTQPHDICAWTRYHTFAKEMEEVDDIQENLPHLPENFTPDFNEPKCYIQQRNSFAPAKGSWDEMMWRYYLWSYYRMVEMVDAEINCILQALEDTGEAENTLVIFTSDHGEGSARHQMITKEFLYEEAVKVPLIFRWPGVLPDNKIDSCNIVSGIDLFPTICDFINIPIPQKMTGTSLKHVIEGDKPLEREYIGIESQGGQGLAIRSKEYKYIAYNDDNTDMLFDMVNDPEETVNLSNNPAYAQIQQQHKKYLKEWVESMDIAPCVPEEYKWLGEN